MALLSIGDLSLEVAYCDFEYGWVHYDISLRWRGEPVINDAILERHNEFWRKRGIGTIKACEIHECGLLPLLRKVIETNESDYWEPTDPDIVLAIYTNDAFPFLPSHRGPPIWRDQSAKAEAEARATMRAEFGPLPDDELEVILFVDVYNFKGAHLYSGDGLCFRLHPTRASLQKFYRELREEYVAFRERHGIEAYNRQEFGPDYREPSF